MHKGDQEESAQKTSEESQSGTPRLSAVWLQEEGKFEESHGQNCTEDREEWRRELQRHCEEVYTDQEETREVQGKELSTSCGRYVDTCDTSAHRDLIRNTFLTLKAYHVIQPSLSRTSLRDQCFFCLVHISVEFCYSVGFGTTGVSGNS